MMNNSLSAAQSWISRDKFKREHANSVIIQIYTKYKWVAERHAGGVTLFDWSVEPVGGFNPLLEKKIKIKNNTDSIPAVYLYR